MFVTFESLENKLPGLIQIIWEVIFSCSASKQHVIFKLSHKVENPSLRIVSSSEESLIKERLCGQPATHELDKPTPCKDQRLRGWILAGLLPLPLVTFRGNNWSNAAVSSWFEGQYIIFVFAVICGWLTFVCMNGLLGYWAQAWGLNGSVSIMLTAQS